MPSLYENLEILLSKKGVTDITPGNIITVTILAMQTIDKYFKGTSEEKNIACKLLIKTACEHLNVKDPEQVSEFLNGYVNQFIETAVKLSRGEYKVNSNRFKSLLGKLKCKCN